MSVGTHTHIQQPPRHCPKAARVRLQSLVFILQHDTLLAVLTHLVLTILPLSCRCYFSLASPPAADGSELEAVCPSTMVNLVGRLEAFAGMSRMKRLALVVLCHTVTDKHLMRLKVRCQLLTAASPAACMTACAAQSGLRQGQRSLPCLHCNGCADERLILVAAQQDQQDPLSRADAPPLAHHLCDAAC